MKPGIVFNASPEAISKEYRYQRGSASCFQLLTHGTYAEAITATEIHLTGDAAPLLSESHDTLIFVRDGKATLIIESDTGTFTEEMHSGSAALVTSGSTFNWKNGSELKALEVAVPDKSKPFSRRMTLERKAYIPFVHQGTEIKGDATGDRQFEVLYSAENGSAGATMFIGFIPTSGAPSHYHLYDEVCQIVRGGGELHIGETIQELTPGSTFVVAPRLLHSIVNNRDEDLWILGIFRPSGSPSAAYYPDGRPAPGYLEID
jgi:mannose-6-phosphate isomerase-like protein (cupin superfamily)